MCNGTNETLPIAPGDWEFSAPLASGSTTCVRDIEANGDLVDQVRSTARRVAVALNR